MRADDVAVTGLGLVTAAGTGAGEFWRTLCAGRPTARPDPALVALPHTFSCRADHFDPERELGGRLSRRLDRFTQLGLSAAQQAVLDAKLDPGSWVPERVGVVLGVGSNSLERYAPEFHRLAAGRPTKISPYALPRSVPNMAAGEVAIHLGCRGPNFVTSSACASGATAIGVARDLVRSGTCDVVLTGGTESGLAPMAVAGFGQLGVLSRGGTEGAIGTDGADHGDPSCEPSCRPPCEPSCRPFDATRDGFVLGEGAAVLVLESGAHARARCAPVRALLRGYGASADAHHATAPHPEGRGAEQAVRSALADAGCAPGDIHHVNAHGTATVVGDAVETAVLRRVFGEPPPVTAAKSVTGHVLGASGAIEAAATVLSLQEQTVPPTANLVHPDPALDLDVVAGRPRPVPMDAALTSSFGFGGQNAVLVFTAG
ncbi:beta-ketoacyl-[acyl-carrier-protein] synthase family protein [Streptomyces purpurogeneiscleroticus]|uniref:beta-ketoacyl-[acyl-carrier-protein] synthase family protein n=1 Tax=Streptomyces purpurogeneiscleroticus TaxID=68259 RepID=UPI001CBD42FF|nr:beta-ketoacyl-[acyl-carrier-protein] synthase family protein [Streptomyces purpurogeneiscleroticus]MBZ4020254.1 3-oxoacyl-ACP synthase [Streptomyces purpurogeneiscleroticus]